MSEATSHPRTHSDCVGHGSIGSLDGVAGQPWLVDNARALA
jgi:hypothetical protein